MKITILGINYYPEQIGIAPYTTSLAEYLKRKGHDVIVYTGFPYYPQWEIASKFKGKLFTKEIINGIVIKRSYIFIPKKINSITRILHELSFLVSSFINMLFCKKTDLLITVSPPIGLGLLTLFFKVFKNTKVIFHIQDLQPDAAKDLGMISNELILKMLFTIEKIIYDGVNMVSVISEKMRSKVVQKAVPDNKVIIFPNWIELDAFENVVKNESFLKRHSLENKFIVMYSGNLGVKQGIEIILDSAERTITNKEIVYIIIGDGANKVNLVNENNKRKLDNIIFLPLQEKEEYPSILATSDVCLIPQKKMVTDIVLPSKLLAIMSSAKPVIACSNEDTELYRIVSESNCGIVIEPENADQLAEAVVKLYNNKGLALTMGENGLHYAKQNFSKEKILDDYLNQLSNIKSLS